VKFVATRKDMATNFFPSSLLLLFLDPGSGMGKNQDPGSRINIPYPQHGHFVFRVRMRGRTTGNLGVGFIIF
jgi:hypothetical protein